MVLPRIWEPGVVAALAFPLSWIIEGVGVPPSSVWAALALTGFGVSAGAFLLQIWAQTIVGATTTAAVVASESAFGVAMAWLVLGERLDLLGLIGGAMILVAVVIDLTKQRDRTSVEAESVSPAH